MSGAQGRREDARNLGGDALADTADLALTDGHLRTAIALFDAAEPEVMDPDRCAGGRWMAHMLAGDFEAAWQESDAIRKRGRPDPHRFWHGEDLRGQRLMLRSLHGFGDAVQMFRFLPRVGELVRELIVEVPPQLVELAPFFSGMGRVITWGEHAPADAPAWDVQMEVMELPYALRVTAEDLPPQQGYLHLPPAMRAGAAGAMREATRLRVGVVWSAGHWNPSRSVPFEIFRSLLAVSGVEFWSLQGDTDRHAWASLAGGEHIRDVYEVGDGILSLAAVIERMDLVITVDTLAAHLAGVLGVPCWVLLQQRADWRWMQEGDGTPWYPTLRLWRQREPGEWGGLLSRVCSALRVWTLTEANRARA